MKLADGIHLIASGHLGISLTHPLDCNAYAVRCGDEYWLIDAGVGMEPQLIAAELEADGIDRGQVKGLLLTHYHLDHCGGAGWMRDHFGLQVVAGAKTAQVVESGDERSISLVSARDAGVYPKDAKMQACSIDRVVGSGETWQTGDVRWEAIEAPGHSADMMCFRLERESGVALFTGDVFFYGGRIVLQDTWDCDVSAYTASLRKLSGITFDSMYAGHSLWSVRDGQRHIEAAMSYVNRLLLPPNL